MLPREATPLSQWRPEATMGHRDLCVRVGTAPVPVVARTVDGESQDTVGVWGWSSCLATFAWKPAEP